jgi:hypothetical protein
VAQLFYTPLFTVKNIKWQIFTAIHPLLIFNLQQIYDPLGTESLSSQVKWPGCEDDFSLPTTAEVKNACKYTSTPPCVFMMWYLSTQALSLQIYVTNCSKSARTQVQSYDDHFLLTISYHYNKEKVISIRATVKIFKNNTFSFLPLIPEACHPEFVV